MGAGEQEKKEKVIHTRISESLDEEVRKHAAGLGVSVSNLVRNILLDTFGLVWYHSPAPLPLAERDLETVDEGMLLKHSSGTSACRTHSAGGCRKLTRRHEKE